MIGREFCNRVTSVFFANATLCFIGYILLFQTDNPYLMLFTVYIVSGIILRYVYIVGLGMCADAIRHSCPKCYKYLSRICCRTKNCPKPLKPLELCCDLILPCVMGLGVVIALILIYTGYIPLWLVALIDGLLFEHAQNICYFKLGVKLY